VRWQRRQGIELAERSQKLVGDDQEHRPQCRAKDGAAAAEHGRDDDLHADGDVDDGVDGRGAHVENQHGAGGAGKQSADAERRDLMLGHVEAECSGFDGILTARLQDQPDRRTRQAEQERGAHHQERQRVPIIDAGVD
jgi:hypothetical protein